MTDCAAQHGLLALSSAPSVLPKGAGPRQSVFPAVIIISKLRMDKQYKKLAFCQCSFPQTSELVPVVLQTRAGAACCA